VLVDELLPWFELSRVELSVQVEVPPSLALIPLPSWLTLVDELVDGSVVCAWAFRPKASDRAVTSKVLFMLKFP